MIKDLKKLEAWFVTGSQHLYGEETLKQVDLDSQEIAEALDRCAEIPVTASPESLSRALGRGGSSSRIFRRIRSNASFRICS